MKTDTNICALRPKGKWSSARMRREALSGYLFLAPGLFGLIFLCYGQMLFSIYISLTDWNVLKDSHFIGLTNYINWFTRDPYFWKSIAVTIYYALGSVVVSQVTALMLALLLNVDMKGRSFFRAALYIPCVIPSVVTCVLWQWLFQTDYGLLNALLRTLGLGKSLWLASEATAIPSLLLMSAWGAGGGMIIYLAGLQGVPKELMEAIGLDGGGVWAKFWHCSLPAISPVLFYNTMMGLIGGFMNFNIPYMMTGGGPNRATTFVNFLIYRTAFADNQMGYSSALAWIVFVILALLIGLYFMVAGRRVYYGD